MARRPSVTEPLLLQQAQNNLARVVCQRGGRTDAKPLLRTLHWLPVKQRVTYKMATLTFKVLSSSTPAYLNHLIQSTVPVRPLRSSDAPLLSGLLQEHELNSLGGHSQSQLHTPGTHCRLTLDLVTLYTPLQITSKHTCLDSLNLKPLAPLYPLKDFKVLYKYCIISIIIHANIVPT